MFESLFSPEQRALLDMAKAALLPQGAPLPHVPVGLEPAPVPPQLVEEDERICG